MTMLLLSRSELSALVHLAHLGRWTLAAHLPAGQQIPPLDRLLARLEHEAAQPDLDDLLDRLLDDQLGRHLDR